MNKHQIPNAPWTSKELALLAKHYPDTNNDDLTLIIRTRTQTAIAHKASKLQLRKSEAFLNSTASGRFRQRQPSLLVRFWQWLKS